MSPLTISLNKLDSLLLDTSIYFFNLPISLFIFNNYNLCVLVCSMMKWIYSCVFSLALAMRWIYFWLSML